MVRRLILLELAAAVGLCGWVVGSFALVPAVVVAAALVVSAVVRRRARDRAGAGTCR
jgi:branched-subunit amino acid transport protein